MFFWNKKKEKKEKEYDDFWHLCSVVNIVGFGINLDTHDFFLIGQCPTCGTVTQLSLFGNWGIKVQDAWRMAVAFADAVS